MPRSYEITRTKSSHSLLQLAAVNRPRVVAIKRFEALLPVIDILPQVGKLLEINCRVIIAIEHADHQSYRLWIEWGPCAIRERLL